MSDIQITKLYNIAVRSLIGSMVVLFLSLVLNLGVYKYRIEKLEAHSTDCIIDRRSLNELTTRMDVKINSIHNSIFEIKSDIRDIKIK